MSQRGKRKGRRGRRLLHERFIDGIRRLGAGHLEATRESLRARSGFGRVIETVKEAVVGQPLATAELAGLKDWYRTLGVDFDPLH